MSLVIDRHDAPPSNVDGESISITLFTTQKPPGRIFIADGTVYEMPRSRA